MPLIAANARYSRILATARGSLFGAVFALLFTPVGAVAALSALPTRPLRGRYAAVTRPLRRQSRLILRPASERRRHSAGLRTFRPHSEGCGSSTTTTARSTRRARCGSACRSAHAPHAPHAYTARTNTCARTHSRTHAPRARTHRTHTHVCTLKHACTPHGADRRRCARARCSPTSARGASCMLRAARCMCCVFMLHVSCCTSCVARCVLHAACHAARRCSAALPPLPMRAYAHAHARARTHSERYPAAVRTCGVQVDALRRVRAPRRGRGAERAEQCHQGAPAYTATSSRSGAGVNTQHAECRVQRATRNATRGGVVKNMRSCARCACVCARASATVRMRAPATVRMRALM